MGLTWITWIWEGTLLDLGSKTKHFLQIPCMEGPYKATGAATLEFCALYRGSNDGKVVLRAAFILAR